MREADPNPTRNIPRRPRGLRRRRPIRNPEIRFPFSSSSSAAAAARPRKAAAGTPQLRWKFENSDSDPCRVAGPGEGGRKGEAESARRLVAAVWRAELVEIEAGPSKPGNGHQHLQHGLNHGLSTNKGSFLKRQSSVKPLDPSMERATKWDGECSMPSKEVYQSFDHLKFLIDQQMTQAYSQESKLKTELDWAKARIYKLESKRHSFKKKVEDILRKHAEEKASWRIREHQKIQAVIEGMKDDLSFERKNRRRTEILNSKLLDELAEAKKSAKRYLHDYEKEKEARELLEDVCDQLAKEVGEDRAEVEDSKRETFRVREELEEERKMLQMAEVWREERVQMKLTDAKLALERQCAQLKKLQTELESFLRSRSHASQDGAAIKEAELLIHAVAESVKIQNMEFTYQPPPASEDIYSIFEEIQQREECKEREIEPCYSASPASDDASKIDAASPATDLFLGKPVNGSVEEDSEWETLSRGDMGSSNSLGGSGESPCDINQDLRKSVSSMSKLWPTCMDNGAGNKKPSVDVAKERAPNGGLNEVSFSPPKLENWSSPDNEKPHVTRGMKGCIEWPRGMHKQSLKTKLLEARLENHKVQIRHVLKQKI